MSVANVVANGVRLHVQRLGGGDRTVVFLHGLVMDNLSSWYFTVANRVAQSADVVLYDLRGHGRSERTNSGYRLDDMVEDLSALLGVLDVARPVHLVGNSLGGLLALAFSVAHPDRVASLALIDAHVGARGWGEQMAATLELQGAQRDTMIGESFKNWLGRHSERKRNRLAQSARALVEGTTLVADMRAASPFSNEQFATLLFPVFALYGEHSDARSDGEQLKAALPNCTWEIVPGCTHSVLWEALDLVRDRIVSWLGSA